MLLEFDMQGSCAVLHQGRKLISCKDKRQTILMDNFNIERSRKILKQKLNRSGISMKHSQHERLKNVSAIRRREMVRRCVRFRYYYYFLKYFLYLSLCGLAGCNKGERWMGVEDGRGLNIKTLKKRTDQNF